MALPHPLTSKGFIDQDELRNLIVVNGLCTYLQYDEFAERFTIADVGPMLKAQTTKKQEHYEMVAVAVKVGYINAKNKGKDHTIFRKEENKDVSKTPERFNSVEDKKQAMADLFSVFDE